MTPDPGEQYEPEWDSEDSNRYQDLGEQPPPAWLPGLVAEVRRVGLTVAQLADAMRANGEDPRDGPLWAARLGQVDAALTASGDLPSLEADPLAALLGGQSLTEFMTGFAEGITSVPLDMLAALTERWQQQEAAQLAAAGIVPVCVVHGDPESAEDERRQHQLHDLAGQAGPYCTITGGNDYTCWHFCGPDAERSALRFIASADGIAQRWWNTTKTAHPVFEQRDPEGGP